MKYPLFRNPEKYMRHRHSGGVLDSLKRYFEHRALDRCLRHAPSVTSVCDAPCGPGRLFPYWQRRGLRTMGVDLSEPMVEAAGQLHRTLGMDGAVTLGNAFALADSLDETSDLVASVRFCYYFQRDERVRLLGSLARASGRYVLVQYKTCETFKGRRNQARRRRSKPHKMKQFCTGEEIRQEVAEAGLTCLAIEPIGTFSDRVFVLAEKTDASRLHEPPSLPVAAQLIPRTLNAAPEPQAPTPMSS